MKIKKYTLNKRFLFYYHTIKIMMNGETVDKPQNDTKFTVHSLNIECRKFKTTYLKIIKSFKSFMCTYT